MVILQLLILCCLIFIFYQDMRYHAVYWICFPILTGMLFFLKQDYAGLKETLQDAVYGFSFFCIQLLLLWVYLSVKHKKAVNLTGDYLGLGDILFLTAIAFYLSPINYILFYVGSLIFVLAYTLINQRYFKKNNLEIPLAGLQALLMGFLLIYTIVNPNLQPYNDMWIDGL